MEKIKLGLGFATGRKSFRKVLNAHIKIWNESKKKLPSDCSISLTLFVAYDVDYSDAKSTDFTNLSQEIVDAFDDIIFMGTKNALKSFERLEESSLFNSTELQSLFGRGYAGKRNAILFSAIENKMDYLIFLDDDEYPVAVTKNFQTCLWSGQEVLLEHLNEIGNADYTHGYHCGYISPVPQIEFNEILTESDFKEFIDAISNDILNWDNIKKLMESGGVTYALTHVLMNREVKEVKEVNHCKFVSGANLCINLRNPMRTFPYYNPPGARGEDTFLSTMLSNRIVKDIPCYAFHDGFSSYKQLLDGALPTQLSPITMESPNIISRFLAACLGWVRYKPLLIYITKPNEFEEIMANMHEIFERVLPKMALYFENGKFMTINDEFEKYRKNIKKHHKQLQVTKNTWEKLMNTMYQIEKDDDKRTFR